MVATCNQALWHCLVMNGAASGVTFPTGQIDIVRVDSPDVDGETVRAVWHQIRTMFKAEWLARVHKEAVDKMATTLARDYAVSAQKMRELCKLAGDLAAKALLAQCPGSMFTRRVRP